MEPSNNEESMDTEPPKSVNALAVETILTNYFERFPPSSESDGNSDNIEGERTHVPRQVHVFDLEMKDEVLDTDSDGDPRDIDTMNRVVNARIKYMFVGDELDRYKHDGVFWVIKIPSKLQVYREIANVFNLSKREISFYTSILPVLQSWVKTRLPDINLEFQVPYCFYAKFDRNADVAADPNIIDRIFEAESILVLQDLRAFDYGKRHFGEGMSPAEAFAAISEITKFHAVTYAMTKLEWTLNFTGLFSPKGLHDLYMPLFKSGVAIFYTLMAEWETSVINESDKISIAQGVKYLEQNIETILRKLLITSEEDFPSTLIHMDLWSDNLLFHIKDEDRENNVPPEEQDLDCAIIDWQMVSYGRPTHDLALLILISMDAGARRENALYLLQYYYQYFENLIGMFGLPMPYSFTDLLKNFSSSSVLAVIMAISSIDLVLQDENAQARLLLLLKDLVDDGTLPTYSPDGNIITDIVSQHAANSDSSAHVSYYS